MQKKPENKNRKYYLNKVVRKFAQLSSRGRTVDISVHIWNDGKLSKKQHAYLNELANDFGYNIQLFIPDSFTFGSLNIET